MMHTPHSFLHIQTQIQVIEVTAIPGGCYVENMRTQHTPPSLFLTFNAYVSSLVSLVSIFISLYQVIILAFLARFIVCVHFYLTSHSCSVVCSMINYYLHHTSADQYFWSAQIPLPTGHVQS